MFNGFLDDLPELDMPRRRKKKTTGPDDQVVRYIRLRCPNPGCGSVQVPVQHTNPEIDGNIIRHHKCLDCGHTFKSIERIS